VASDISIGTLLADRYEILSEIGRGRVGIVYKAVHKRLDKTIAVKVLFEDVGSDETAMKRFEHEARSTSRLSHPNIIDVLDYGSSRAGFPYLVIEYIDGTDLQDVISRETRISLGRTVKIISQVCGALAHAHNKGIIHRDLKPSNIMLMDYEGYPDFVKLVDFGIAKRYDGDEVNIERLTADGQVLGTPAYMSPEQCQAGKLDARSDIYSLGCVMFKMLTGIPPIAGSSIIDIIHSHISNDPLSFAEACPDVRIPPGIQEIVMTALEKDPRKRHQTMLEFSNLLNAAVAVTGGSATSTTSGIPAFGRFQPIAGGAPFASGNPLTLPAMPGSTAGGVATPTGGMPAIGSAESPEDDAAAVYRARKFDALLEAAQGGDVRAQFEVAIRLYNGDGVNSNQMEAMKWLRTAAQGGNKEAQYQLGKRLLEGEGLVASPVEGFTWLLKAAEQGHDGAQVMAATCYEEGRGTVIDLLKAAHFYRAAVKKGNLHAMPKLAGVYERANEAGLEAEGYNEWLEERASDGDVDALYQIACLRKGSSTKLSRQAIGQLLPDAQIGNYKAMMAVAQLYANGRQPDDAKNAFFWLTKASETGSGEALVALACAHKNGVGCPRDPARAAQLLQQAADTASHLDAQALLGASMMIGDGVPRNLTRGMNYLRNAANAGSSLAAWKLALCFKNGLGAVRDTKEAERLFDRAAEGKFDQGPNWQWTIPQLQFSEAIQTFQSLAQIEHRQAHYWLGICFENGVGVQRDLNKALECYMKSANKGWQPALDAAKKLKQLASAN
jgi:TPR repeat protein